MTIVANVLIPELLEDFPKLGHCREQIIGERKAEYERMAYQVAEANAAEKAQAERLQKEELKYRDDLQVT